MTAMSFHQHWPGIPSMPHGTSLSSSCVMYLQVYSWVHLQCQKRLDTLFLCMWLIPVGHGLHTQFTRPFLLLRKWVWLARLVWNKAQTAINEKLLHSYWPVFSQVYMVRMLEHLKLGCRSYVSYKSLCIHLCHWQAQILNSTSTITLQGTLAYSFT